MVDGGIYRHDFVAQAVVDGLMQVQLQTNVPTFSVSLTPHHYQPTPEHDTFFGAHFIKKGAEAAEAVLMVAPIVPWPSPPTGPDPAAVRRHSEGT